LVITPEELKKRRIELGLTQKGLSEAINVSQSIISKFEAKKNYPGYHTIKEIEERIYKLGHGSEKKIDSVMVRHIHSFRPDAKVRDVMRLFKTKGYSQAPVIDSKGRVVGLITAQGLLDADKDESILQLLEPEPPIIAKDAPVSAAKTLLKGFPLVLVNDRGKIVGIVAREDVL
jgi:predicted transcriptional regulator